MQQTPKQASNSQPRYFSRYLSLIPVIAVVSISLAFTAWLLINTVYPDRLFFLE
ncbi:PsaJ protein [filamentous cyanobacterium CCP2]|jgi:photosystem I subunit 9|nr:PsaJ protein [filamentous cyanobacterium CCP2]